MHVHGVRKNAASYEHIDPTTVGNERRVLVSELSGKSNIAAKLGEHDLEHDAALLAKVLDRVQDLENEGYQFEAAEASFVLLVERLAGRYDPWFERLGYHVSVSGQHATGEPITEATVKLRVGDDVEHTVSEGDGPVNALDGACARRWRGTTRASREMHLVDYKVRVINARAGTAARVRVVIESRDERRGLGHGRRLREHHRGKLAGPGRRLRPQALPGRPRRDPAPPARAARAVTGARGSGDRGRALGAVIGVR